MSYLIDSDYIVDWLKGYSTATALLNTIASSGSLAISIISYGEIYEGIYYGTDPKRYEAVFRRFLRGVAVLPLTRRTMHEFARVRGQLRHTGNSIPDADLLIAATALQAKRTLVTRNTRHFRCVPGIAIY